MTTLVSDCPHCGAANMSFTVFGASSAVKVPGTFTGQIRVAAECGRCLGPIAAVMKTASQPATKTWDTLVSQVATGPHAIPNDLWEVIDSWPAMPKPRVPDLLTADVEKAFLQGEKNLQMDGCEEPAATMFRRALDLALKEAHPDIDGNLVSRIKTLHERKVLPETIVDWAHAVRMIGNDGAHQPEGCTRDDAIAARDFVDAVLRYLFSLPRMIKARRAELLATKSDQSSQPAP